MDIKIKTNNSPREEAGLARLFGFSGLPLKRKLSFFFLPCLLAWFFVFSNSVLAEDKLIDYLLIVEIQTSGEKTNNDYIKIYNPSDNKINLNGYRLVKRTESGEKDSLIKSWDKDVFIDPRGYFLWANSENDFADLINADVKTTATIADNNGIAVRQGKSDEGNIIDSVGWGNCKNIFVEGKVFPKNPDKNKILKRKNQNIDTNDNSNDFIIYEPEKNSNPKEYSSQIRINEILPNPSGKESEEEYIELYNFSKEKIDLENWKLKDFSGEEYEFPKATILEKENYLVIFRKDFKFAINNSKETIWLLNPEGEMISMVALGDKSFGTDISYSFDGLGWRRSSYLTRGESNRFDEAPKIKIKKDEKILKNIYANFQVDTGNKKQKVVWDFGDGHKSYLQKTRHKFSKKGIYEVNLKVIGKSDDFIESFSIKVENFNEEKLKIVGVNPNPKGKDANYETIKVKNNSKKKINLKGWSIATGWKNLYNHPINKKLTIKPGETKEITRKFSAFSLNNKQTKIELRYPDGKVASKVKYSKKEGIKEDEIFEKEEDGWVWIGKEIKENEQNVPIENQAIQNQEREPENNKNLEEKIILEEGKDNQENRKEEEDSEGAIFGSGEVLGIETEKREVKTVGFFRKIAILGNAKINQLINLFVQ